MLRALSAAGVIGVGLGIVRGVEAVAANRCLGFGFEMLALHYGVRALHRSVALVSANLALVLLAGHLVFWGLARWSADPVRAGRLFSLVLGMAVAGSGCAFVGYKLNHWPRFPDALSSRGLMWNAAIVVLFGLSVVPLRALIGRWGPNLWRGFLAVGRPLLFIPCLGVLLSVNAAERIAFGLRGPDGPPVIFVTVDTLRADHLGCYGYVRDTSPRLDRLAAESVRFDQAIVQWPKTGPSFASMLTSTYGHFNGLIRHGRKPVSEKLLLLAELMKEHGYRTAAIVTNPNVAARYKFDQGFDHYREIWREDPAQDGETVTLRAVQWLERNKEDRPFFLWLHYVDPHAKYAPPAPYHEMFVGDPHYDPGWRVPLGTELKADIGSIPIASQLPGRDEIAYYVAQYDAEIRYVDAQIGRVLDALQALGLYENSLIVFTSDHGESLGEHNYFFEHGRLPYDTCARVPLFLRLPGGAEAGRVVERPVELIHLVPTILELAALPPHPEAQGRSLVPLLYGRDDPLPEWAFTESGYEQDYQRAMRNATWKLIYVPSAADRAIMQGTLFELYRIAEDPGELRNLVNEEPALARELQQRLLAWVEASRTGARLPEAETFDLDPAGQEALRSLGYVE